MRNPKWHRDEIILALDLYFDKDLGSFDARNPKIIALSELLNRLPIFTQRPDAEKFRNPNGVNLKLSNFMAMDPNYRGQGMTSFSKLDKEVFEEFSNDLPGLKRIAEQIRSSINDPELSSKLNKVEDDENTDGDSVKEGQVLYKMHKVRERDRKIIDKKKKKVFKETGRLACEACDLDFQETYGDLGAGFIECHHLVPLYLFEVSKETKLEDLALLCSNCHRMIHRDSSISTIKEFKARWGN